VIGRDHHHHAEHREQRQHEKFAAIHVARADVRCEYTSMIATAT
jgi:hypothetical protein